MSARFSLRCFSLLLVSCCTVSGCSFLPTQNPSSGQPPETERVDEATHTSPQEGTAATKPDTDADKTSEKVTPKAAVAPPNPQQNFFADGVNRAQSAVSIGQSAQSPDDWKLVESRWNQAVALMQQVPDSDPNHATAKQKVTEYQEYASQAAQKATAETSISGTTVADNGTPSGLVAQIPVVDRMGGTPVVPVTLTGNEGTQRFNMLFDTGASATLITPAMARAVGVVIIGEATVIVADGRRVQIPIGYVDTLEVGGLVVRDIRVGIGGDVALLGQDVYGQYGISAGGSSINLYE